RPQVWRVDSDHRQVSVRVIADRLRFILTAVRQGDFDPGCAVRHVTVGENEAIRREDEAGTAPARLLWVLSPPVPTVVTLTANFNVDDRRTHPISDAYHRLRIGV